MQRFVLRQNLTRFRNLLAQETNETRQKTLRSLICVAQRQLASLDSAESGVLSPGSWARETEAAAYRHPQMRTLDMTVLTRNPSAWEKASKGGANLGVWHRTNRMETEDEGAIQRCWNGRRRQPPAVPALSPTAPRSE